MPSELSELIADVKEQVLYLQELGVESLAVDLPESVSQKSKVQSTKSQVSGIPAPIRAAPVKSFQSQTAGSRLASLPSLSSRTIATPTNKTPDEQNMNDISNKTLADETLFGEIGPTLPETGETIESIRAEIGNCTRCPLHAGRKQVVHSSGNFNADLMFVGEAPGADEDEQGFPFVGRAGQLLTKIIESIGMHREDVFIGNINRCRPPGNRAPEPPETAACRPYLLREVAVVKPKVIVVLGATAAHNLLQTKTPISKLRGNFQEYLGVKVMPTFHPAYLLRDPHKKREVWEDMKKVREFLQS
jgi:uracil-DNA glycosylase